MIPLKAPAVTRVAVESAPDDPPSESPAAGGLLAPFPTGRTPDWLSCPALAVTPPIVIAMMTAIPDRTAPQPMTSGLGSRRTARKLVAAEREIRLADRENDGTKLLLARFSLGPMSIPMLAAHPPAQPMPAGGRCPAQEDKLPRRTLYGQRGEGSRR